MARLLAAAQCLEQASLLPGPPSPPPSWCSPSAPPGWLAGPVSALSPPALCPRSFRAPAPLLALLPLSQALIVGAEGLEPPTCWL